MDPMASPPQPPFLVFGVFFVAVWIAVGFLVGTFSGWRLLASRFRLEGEFCGNVHIWQSARMKSYMDYHGVLKIGANDEGLYLATSFLFRLGHPALLIPWREIELGPRRRKWFFPTVELRLGRDNQVPLVISAGLAESLRIDAGEVWPPKTTSG
jgi:hypothetical protein